MKKNLKKILVGLVVVIVLAVIFLRGDQLEELVTTIERGAPLFLIGAVVFQLGKYFAQGASFIWCFKSVGSRLSLKEGIKLVFATFFVDTVIPSFNMSGTSIVIAEAAHEHISAGKATGAALLRQVSINAGFLVIMVIGFCDLGYCRWIECRMDSPWYHRDPYRRWHGRRDGVRCDEARSAPEVARPARARHR